MVLADVIAQSSLYIGQVLWYFAIILHLFFATSFVYYRAKDFNLNQMLPSWYVPPVGIVVACVTGAGMYNSLLTHTLFYFGFGCYLIMLPIMMYRLIFGERIQDAHLPAFAIMGAPASLCLAGYLTAFSMPSGVIVGFLLALSLIMTALVYISIFRINHLRISFIPIYASFTFPLAIGSTALLKYAAYLGSTAGYFWHSLGQLEMIFALIVIIWVLFNMTRVVLQKVIWAK
jgi:tellurite resistance protein TehA-like permease